ncbi:MAG: LysR family transcriptional regulator [Comamonas sp.]
MNISLRQIRAFVCVASHRSVTQAAREMHLTQSAVSMLIQQFGEQAGVRLFERSQGSMQLTHQGQELLPQARRVLASLEQMEASLHDMQRMHRERLRIAVPQLLACTWLPRVLDSFGQLYPDVALTVVDGTADEVLGVVRSGDAELGIGPERQAGPEINRIFLTEVPMVLVFAQNHRFAQCERVAWSDLGSENWIAYSSEFNHYLEKLFERNNLRFGDRTITQVNHLTTALALAGNGMGVTAVPAYAAQLSGSFGLRHVRLHTPELGRDFFIYHQKGALLSPAAQVFCKSLSVELKRLGAQ